MQVERKTFSFHVDFKSESGKCVAMCFANIRAYKNHLEREEKYRFLGSTSKSFGWSGGRPRNLQFNKEALTSPPVHWWVILELVTL